MGKTAVLVMNTGSPAEATVPAVRAYLNEFLSDAKVMTMPAPLRWLLLHGIILRKRPAKVAPRYASIWLSEGSPHIVYSERFVNGLNDISDGSYEAFSLMRYGNPTISESVQNIISEGCSRFLVVPMFPQFAEATSGTCLTAVEKAISSILPSARVASLSGFHAEEGYLSAVSEAIGEIEDEHLLFAFHGLPMKQIRKVHSRPPEDNLRPCKDDCDAPKLCYTHQCEDTAKALAEKLRLSPSQWSLSYQSRLGRAEWSAPYTDEHVAGLAARGVKSICVVTPGFTTDCLETLEELGVRLKSDFLANGGENFRLIPCLNDEQGWVAAFDEIIMDALKVQAD